MIDDSFFTNSIARKVMGRKEYDVIWHRAYDDSYDEQHDHDTAERHADMATRMQGYGMLRAAAYMLSGLEVSDDYIEDGIQSGKSMQQIQREWKEKRTRMMQKLAAKAGITYDMVVNLADDMRKSIEEGMKEYTA